MPKTRILDLLGENALLLPARLSAAIVANEQAKYILGLLQMAAANADSPRVEAPGLRAEREACGLAEPQLDRVVARSEALGQGVYHIPEAARLLALLSAALDAMLAPLVLADPEARELVERKERLIAAVPPLDGDVIGGDAIVRHLEGAADSLMRAGLALRDHILGEAAFDR